jgi:hypothetical protein
MFWFLFDVLTLRRLGLARPLRYAILIVLFGCLIAGVIYTTIFLNAARSLPEKHHVQHISAH